MSALQKARYSARREGAGCFLLLAMAFGFNMFVIGAQQDAEPPTDAILCEAGETASFPLPANYDSLVEFAEANYASGVDARSVIDRFCWITAETPELPFTETVTAWTVIAWKESHGRDWAKGAAGERGTLQLHPCHAASMKRHALDFNNEEDRIRKANMMLAENLYAGHSWWSALSPWSVTRNRHKQHVRGAYDRLMEDAGAGANSGNS